jgi:uncharacterized protein (DUF736 family)
VKAAKKPDFSVHGKTMDGTTWTLIGAAWSNTKPDGTPYTRVKLNFRPNTETLMLWPWGTKPSEDA